MDEGDVASLAVALLALALGVYNALRERQRDTRQVSLYTRWDWHQFGDAAEPERAIRVDVANDGHRPVRIRAAGTAHGEGLHPEAHRVEGLPSDELTDGRDATIWLGAPSDGLVERYSWPSRVWVQDANRRKYFAAHPAPVKDSSDGDF